MDATKLSFQTATIEKPALDTPVARIARPDPVCLLEDETVSQALSRLRGESLGERIVYFYVVGPQGTLEGVVPTRRLLLSEPETRVGDVMIRPVAAVKASDTFGTALGMLTAKRLLALPVIDEDDRLVGVLDISTSTQTLVDLERREGAEEVFQIAGVQLEEEKNRTASSVLATRFPWILCNIASGLAAAWIANVFDAVLQTVVALAFFVPLVLTIAESIAMQSVTISVQRLHVARHSRVSPVQSAIREMRVGMLLGMVSGVIVGIVGIAWLGMPKLAAVVSASIAVAGAVGAVLGYFVPLLVHRWKLDPKIASGPAVLALTDVAAITFYFGVAGLVLL